MCSKHFACFRWLREKSTDKPSMRMYRVTELRPVLSAVVRYEQTALKLPARTVDSLSMNSGSTTGQSGEAPLITQTHKVEWGHHVRWRVTITACRLRLADGEMETATNSLDRSAVDCPGCAGSTAVADSGRNQNGTLHTGSVRSVESRVSLISLSRSVTKPVSSSEVLKTRISSVAVQSRR